MAQVTRYPPPCRHPSPRVRAPSTCAMSRATAGFSATTATVMGPHLHTYSISTSGTSRLLAKNSTRRLATPAASVLAIAAVVSVSFASGTIEVRGWPEGLGPPPTCAWDARTRCHRAPASAYADVVRALVASKTPYEDTARRYTELEAGARVHRDPRPYQTEALAAWRAARGRGVVVLPTGAGKSHVALLAIDDRRRSTLVVAPTLDLVRQWFDLLGATFGGPIGLVGGGDHDVQPITVTTYDSAFLHMEHLGARFGLVVFDECHHLPGRQLRARRARLSRALPARAHGDARTQRRARRGAREPRRARRLPQGHHRALRGLPRRVRHRAGRPSSSPRRSAPSTTPNERPTGTSSAAAAST